MLNGKLFLLGVVMIWLTVIFLFTEITYFSGEHTESIIGEVIHHTPIKALPNEIHDTESGRLKTINYLVRKSSHMIVFGILAFSIWKLIQPNRFSYLIAWIFTTIYAALDEWHQSFVPWRSSHFSDVIIDSLAALIILLTIFINKKVKILIIL